MRLATFNMRGGGTQVHWEVTVLGGEPWTRLSDHNPVVAVLDGSID